MNYSIDLVYTQYIKPLSYNERVIIVQKILHDFLNEPKKEMSSHLDKLSSLKKFKGIAKNNNQINIEEDWYKQ